jgi:hypothetical protein
MPSSNSPVDPLHWDTPIVDGNGRPTLEFQRKFNAQRVTNDTDATTIAAAQATADAALAGLAAKVDIAGDTMTGFLTLHADPTSDLHAATKQYVDDTAAAGTFLGLTDTPAAYTGQTLKVVRVNAAEDALEFVAAPSLSGDAEDVTYDNEVSDLTATDVQAAIDEMVGLLMHVSADMTTYRGHPVTCDRTLFTCDRGYF